VLRTNNLVDQEKAVIANQMLANSVIAQTPVDQTRIVQLLVREGYPFVAKPSGLCSALIRSRQLRYPDQADVAS
jgi:hypothetical protein